MENTVFPYDDVTNIIIFLNDYSIIIDTPLKDWWRLSCFILSKL